MNEVKKRAAIQGRRSTNLTLPEGLVERARSLGVNLSAAAEGGIRDAVAAAADEEFARQNRPAIDAWNAWLAEHGSPLDEFQAF